MMGFEGMPAYLHWSLIGYARHENTDAPRHAHSSADNILEGEDIVGCSSDSNSVEILIEAQKPAVKKIDIRMVLARQKYAGLPDLVCSRKLLHPLSTERFRTMLHQRSTKPPN
jgi:hypothetical protein